MSRATTLDPAEVDLLVKRQVRTAAQAVTVALRGVEQAHTARSRRVARHLAGVLRMLQDTGRVTSPFNPAEQPSEVKGKLTPTLPPAPKTTNVEALDE